MDSNLDTSSIANIRAKKEENELYITLNIYNIHTYK